ncbi:hypothetical protein HDU91_005828 [Kappamyces sp. JEL0680]|nr:hypothetical protein HDU91_005828 [Kappamyces sp. JEL0680]
MKQAAAPSTSVLNPINNTFVIAGIVAGGLIFIGAIFLLYQRFSKMRQRPTTAFEPNKRQSKFASTFSLFRRNDDAPPPLPTTMSDNRQPRSSLFTTIRASQIFRNGAAPPPLPTGPIPGISRDDPFSQRSQRNPPSEYAQSNAEGYKVQVFEDYDAGMDDEISCAVGDIIIVKEEYDDGMLRRTDSF